MTYRPRSVLAATVLGATLALTGCAVGAQAVSADACRYPGDFIPVCQPDTAGGIDLGSPSIVTAEPVGEIGAASGSPVGLEVPSEGSGAGGPYPPATPDGSGGTVGSGGRVTDAEFVLDSDATTVRALQPITTPGLDAEQAAHVATVVADAFREGRTYTGDVKTRLSERLITPRAPEGREWATTGQATVYVDVVRYTAPGWTLRLTADLDATGTDGQPERWTYSRTYTVTLGADDRINVHQVSEAEYNQHAATGGITIGAASTGSGCLDPAPGGGLCAGDVSDPDGTLGVVGSGGHVRD
jgi:hypothetical protein